MNPGDPNRGAIQKPARSWTGGTPPRPASLPEPTYWPAALALGIAFVAWGLVTTLLITALGLALSALALARWIREMHREHS